MIVDPKNEKDDAYNIKIKKSIISKKLQKRDDLVVREAVLNTLATARAASTAALAALTHQTEISANVTDSTLTGKKRKKASVGDTISRGTPKPRTDSVLEIMN